MSSTAASLARLRIIEVALHLRTALTQAAKVAISSLALYGTLATVVAARSGAISYRELCSLWMPSTALMCLLFILFTGIWMIHTKESWQIFLNRLVSSFASGIIITLLAPTP